MKLINADYLTGRIFTEASLKNAHTCYESIMAIIKSMESEDVLDKIRAEIEEKYEKYKYLFDTDFMGTKDLEWVLSVIDKYRNEVSE